MSRSDLYLTSFYFTTTTITTVGYGDFSANTFLEKIICICIMIAGVITFSLASASLTNYIATLDKRSVEYETKMGVLDRLFRAHSFPQNLYSRIKKNIQFNHIEDKKSVSDFVEDLPLDLRTPLSIHIYREVYTNVDFLRGKEVTFISWICPLLKTRVSEPQECIYYEGDELNDIYFLKNGNAEYVLPRYGNQPYIQIVEHTCFGLIDIIAALLEKEKHIKEFGIMDAVT